MFMLKSTHEHKMNQLRAELISANMEIVRLKISNMRQSFAPAKSSQFTDDQLRRLIQLCHPDRHNGSRAAVEATQMLNSIRKQTRR